jgi:hypothetical protein
MPLSAFSVMTFVFCVGCFRERTEFMREGLSEKGGHPGTMKTRFGTADERNPRDKIAQVTARTR